MSEGDCEAASLHCYESAVLHAGYSVPGYRDSGYYGLRVHLLRTSVPSQGWCVTLEWLGRCSESGESV